jgi:multisubunit Na+/H+ antiporter MnhG subunit
MPPRPSFKGTFAAVQLALFAVAVFNVVHALRARRLADALAAVLIWIVIAPVFAYKILKSDHPETRS